MLAVSVAQKMKDDKRMCCAGKPVFGTLIALLRDGVPVLGIIDQPITKERWLGIHGRQTTLNGKDVNSSAQISMLRSKLFCC